MNMHIAYHEIMTWKRTSISAATIIQDSSTEQQTAMQYLKPEFSPNNE